MDLFASLFFSPGHFMNPDFFFATGGSNTAERTMRESRDAMEVAT